MFERVVYISLFQSLLCLLRTIEAAEISIASLSKANLLSERCLRLHREEVASMTLLPLAKDPRGNHKHLQPARQTAIPENHLIANNVH